jgi:hypothetical protein
MNEVIREKVVLDLASRYLTNNIGMKLDDNGMMKVPSVEVCFDGLLVEKPLEWWGDEQDVFEWARYARDQIIEGRNYMASKGRGLHDEPVDPAWCYQ